MNNYPRKLLALALVLCMLVPLCAFPAGAANSQTEKPIDYQFEEVTPEEAAQSTGLVNGYPDGSYRHDAPVTREQMATILQRYAQWKGLSFGSNGSAASRFADFGLVSGYAKNAVQWATLSGILNGDGCGRLNPAGSATRAEIAAMLMNFDTSKK